MMFDLALALLAIAMAAVAGRTLMLSFRAQKPEDYAETGPTFDLPKVLSGPIVSEGLIYGPNGRMTNSFTARMFGEWQGQSGTLSEDFVYSNGSQMHRKWVLTMTSDTTFTATADDIVGTGQGVISGATVQLRYRIRLPENAGGHVLDTVDWMYLMADGTIMNRSQMRKFGLQVAELVATMRPDEAADQQTIAAQ